MLVLIALIALATVATAQLDCTWENVTFVRDSIRDCHLPQLRNFIDSQVENRFSTCRGPFDWNITVVNPSNSVFLEEVYDAGYEVCETRVRFWASIRGPLLSFSSSTFPVFAPFGRVGPNGKFGDSVNQIPYGNGEAISTDQLIKARTMVIYLQQCNAANETSAFSDRLFIELRDSGSVDYSFNYDIHGTYPLAADNDLC